MFASSPSSARPSLVGRILGVALLTVTYFAAARVGFQATVGSPVVSTLWAPSGLALFGLLRFGTWVWPGIALGALWLPPGPFPEVRDRPANRRLLEGLLLLAATGLLAELIFSQTPAPWLYMFFPLVMLIAWRVGLRGAAAGVVLLALIASWFTVKGSGPLSTYPFQERLFLLQLFLAFLAVTSLAFAAALAERASSEAETRQQARQLQAAQAVAKMGSWHWDLQGDRVTWSPELFRIYGVSPDEFGGTLQAFMEQVHPDDRAGLRAEVERALAERRGFHVHERIVRPDGEIRVLASVGEVLLDPVGKPAAMMGICHDVTEQWQAQAALRGREAQLHSLHRATHLVSSTLDLDRLLELLVELGAELTEAESGCAGLRTEAGMVVRRYFHRGAWIPFDYTWPPGHGIPGWVLEHCMTYLTNDASDDPRIEPVVRDAFTVRSVLAIPILGSETEPVGFLQLHNKKTPGGFTAGDRELLVAVGRTTALAIQNAQAYTQLGENRARLQDLSRRLLSAHEEERRRIAREIHDELGQDLTAVKFGIENLRRRLADHSRKPALIRRAGQLGRLVDATLQAMQDIVHRLRPAVLDHLGLIEALEWSGQEFGRKTGIPCKLSLPEQLQGLDPEVATVVFRIAQEALTNIVRHSEASRVHLGLAMTASTLMLRVEDDGRGFEPSDLAKPGSVGVIGMRERAAAVGGTVELAPTPGGGTTVSLTIPLAGVMSDQSALST